MLGRPDNPSPLQIPCGRRKLTPRVVLWLSRVHTAACLPHMHRCWIQSCLYSKSGLERWLNNLECLVFVLFCCFVFGRESGSIHQHPHDGSQLTIPPTPKDPSPSFDFLSTHTCNAQTYMQAQHTQKINLQKNQNPLSSCVSESLWNQILHPRHGFGDYSPNPSWQHPMRKKESENWGWSPDT